jgi:hypothetical protein
MQFASNRNYQNHLLTAKHKRETEGNNIAQQNTQHECDICNMTFSNKRNFDSHLLSKKHHKMKNTDTSNENLCLYCGKEYKCRSGLWKHIQKIHKNEEEMNIEEETDDEHNEEPSELMENMKISPELMLFLIQQNKQMQEMMMEQNTQNKSMVESLIELAKNMGSNNHNTNTQNTNNSHNKAFNMNFFLNETCKNAMNMSDFVRNLVVTTDDFEQTGILGYVEGICRIMENGLNKLDVHERPIHCSDVKRETIYIKEDGKWEKDDANKTKLLDTIKQVGIKNINVIPQWCKEHPGWSDSDSKENDRYLKYVMNAMCGGTDEEILHNYGKIMRHISRITMVDKEDAIV